MDQYLSSESISRLLRSAFQLLLSGAVYEMLALAGVPVEGWLAGVLFLITVYAHQVADDLGIKYPAKTYLGRRDSTADEA